MIKNIYLRKIVNVRLYKAVRVDNRPLGYADAWHYGCVYACLDAIAHDCPQFPPFRRNPRAFYVDFHRVVIKAEVGCYCACAQIAIRTYQRIPQIAEVADLYIVEKD